MKILVTYAVVLFLAGLAFCKVSSETERYYSRNTFVTMLNGFWLACYPLFFCLMCNLKPLDKPIILRSLEMLMYYGIPMAVATVFFKEQLDGRVRGGVLILLGLYFYIPLDIGILAYWWKIGDLNLEYAFVALWAIFFIPCISCGIVGEGNIGISSHFRILKYPAIPKYHWKIVFKTFLVLFCALVPIGYLMNFIQFKFDLTRLGTYWYLVVLVLPFAIFLMPAFIEELVFRGCIQGGLKLISPASSPIFCIIISAIVFGLFHLNNPAGSYGWPNWRYAILATIAGIGYGYVYEKTKNLALSTFLHMMVDVTWLLFFRGK